MAKQRNYIEEFLNRPSSRSQPNHPWNGKKQRYPEPEPRIKDKTQSHRGSSSALVKADNNINNDK